MNKSFIMATRPEWTKMYGNGKDYEFRGNNFSGVKSGMVGYVYESKGKRIKNQCVGTCDEDCQSYSFSWSEIETEVDHCAKGLNPIYDRLYYEGKGKVIGRFTVGKVYNDLGCGDYREYKSHIPYLISLKDEFKKVPSTLNPYEFIKQNNKVMKLDDARKIGYANQQIAFEILDYTPIEPLDVSEFTLWKYRDIEETFIDKVKHIENVLPNNFCNDKYFYTDEIQCGITNKRFTRQDNCQDKDCPLFKVKQVQSIAYVTERNDV